MKSFCHGCALCYHSIILNADSGLLEHISIVRYNVLSCLTGTRHFPLAGLYSWNTIF